MQTFNSWRRRISRMIQLFTILVASFAVCQSVLAESPRQATSSPEAREQAIRSIPFSQLTEPVQERIMSVVSRPTIYRRLPIEIIHCNPSMHRFLVRYPEVIVSIWRVMGATNCTTKRTGPYSLAAADGSGTQGNVELVYGTNDTHVLYAEGSYEGPLFRRQIKGRVVLLLKSGYAQDLDGRDLVTNRMDLFIQMDNVGADLIAKTLQSVVGQSADHNFAQSAQFIGRLSDVAEVNGPGVQRLAAKLTEVTPAVRRRFAEVAIETHHRASLRDTSTLYIQPNAPSGVVQNSVIQAADSGAQ